MGRSQFDPILTSRLMWRLLQLLHRLFRPSDLHLSPKAVDDFFANASMIQKGYNRATH